MSKLVARTLTPHQGLLDVGQVKAGEKLLVSGAAGATGSVVCQIGKKKGAKVIAIAGSDEKCQWLEKDLGVDKALNYKSPSFYDDFKKEVGYLDVFFDTLIPAKEFDHADDVQHWTWRMSSKTTLWRENEQHYFL